MKKLLPLVLALSFLLSLASPAHAVSEAAEPDPTAVANSVDKLHLSESELTFSAGDLIELQILPVELAKPLGWDVSDIEFSEEGILTILPEDDPEVVAYLEASVEDQEEPATNASDRETLSIFLKAQRSGTCRIEVTLENPLYDGPVELTISAQSLDQRAADLVSRTSQVLTRPFTPRPHLPVAPLEPTPPVAEPPASEPPSGGNGTDVPPSNDGQEFPSEDVDNPDTPETPEDPKDPDEPDNPDPPEQPNKPSRPSGSGSSRPSRPSEPTNPEDPKDPENPDNPDPEDPDNPNNPDNPDNPDPEDPKDPDEPDNPDPPLVFDASSWQFDATSLSVVYDGEEHHPILNGVPETVTMTATGAATNAGTYQYAVSFQVPDGYEPVADMTVEYEITPATVTISQQYDFTTGKVKPVLTGLVASDIQVVTQVDNEDTDTIDASRPGTHTASTTVTIDADKQQNYRIDSDLTTTTIYNVKSKTPWCNVDLESSREGDQIVIKVKLNDLKIEQVQKSNSKVTLGMKVHHDPSKLTYQSDAAGYWGNGFSMGSYYWVLGTYEAYPGRPLPADTLVLALYYDLVNPEDDQDLVFNIDQIQLVPNIVGADDVLNFQYNVGDLSFVINPSQLNVEDILIDRNPIEDADFRDKNADTATREEQISRLEQYIKDNFNLPDDSGNLDDPNNPNNSDNSDSPDNPSNSENPSSPGGASISGDLSSSNSPATSDDANIPNNFATDGANIVEDVDVSDDLATSDGSSASNGANASEGSGASDNADVAADVPAA